MKKILFLLSAALTLTGASAQTKNAKLEKLKQHIIDLDTKAWEAWKNKNVQWFRDHTTEDFLSISGNSVSTKADVLKATPTECDVKSYALDNFQFVMLNETAVVLTYTVVQNATCGGEKIPAKVRASVNYVKRNGKWIEAFYVDGPIE